MKSPREIAQKWARNLGSSGESIKSGVLAVTESPTAKAAGRLDAYIAGAQRAVADGSMQRALLAVSNGDWQKATIDKGIPRVLSGATAAVPKMEGFLSEFLPYVADAQRQLESMPRGNIEQNKARMVAMVDMLSRFKRR